MSEGMRDLRSRAYLRPGFVLRRVVNPLIARLGMATVLAVRGRKTGRWHTVPVHVLECGGRRYLLVAPRGETDWVRNLRAAVGGELRWRGRIERFQAVKVPDAEKSPLIQAYLQRWGAQVRAQFGALPDPADHPVFRIEPVKAASVS